MRTTLLILAVALARRQDPQEPTGPKKLESIEFPDLADAARKDRRVPLKLHLPEGDGRFPLVVFSHGGGGTWDANIYQARDLASHGYAVLCVEHVCSNNDVLKEDIRKATGTIAERLNAALQKMTCDPAAVLERPRDVTFAIDRAVEWDQKHAKLKGRIDTSKIAVAGHSFGAYTTMVACGARPTLDHLDPPVEGKGLAKDLSDPRVTCGIAMSPQGVGTSRFVEESYATLRRPLLCFSGSLDTQFGADGKLQPASRRLDAFKLYPEGDKYMAWLENADHLAFSDNPDSSKMPSKSRADAQKITRALTRLFCDAYLKGDAEAKKKLNGEFADSLKGKVVTKVGWFAR
jgi:predicted dienelactone hydrolase